MIFQLETKTVIAEFDLTNGDIVSLTNKNTGWNVISGGNAISYELFIPTEKHRFSRVFGAEQKPPISEYSADKLEMRWDGLISEFGESLDITFKATVRVRSDGSLLFSNSLENRSPFTVESVKYPYLRSISNPTPNGNLHYWYSAYLGMNRGELYPSFWDERGYWGTDNPMKCVSDPYNMFIAVEGEKEGMYFGLEDQERRYLVEYWFNLNPGCITSIGYSTPGASYSPLEGYITMDVRHFPFCAPGENTSLSDISFYMYEGDWHTATDIYRSYHDKWFKPAPSPEWIHEPHSWQQVQINNSAYQYRCRYTDLIKHAEECKKHGITAIQLVGWTNMGQDGDLPNHGIDPNLGTYEELKKAISDIEAMGIHVVLYCKYVFCDQGNTEFKEKYYKLASRDIQGNIHSFPGYNYGSPAQLSSINTHRLVIMCQNSREWQDVPCRTQKSMIELGASGMLNDESAQHCNMRYCFDPAHGHHVPAYLGHGIVKMEKRLREITPDNFLMCGEGLYDQEFENYTLSYVRIFDVNAPQFQRYLDSRAEVMVGVWGYDDRETINAAMLFRYIISYEPLHFKGWLNMFPLTLEYGKKADALRLKYREYFWDGEYRDNLDADLYCGSEKHRNYTVYRAKNGNIGIMVANFDRTSPITIRLDTAKYHGYFTCASPEAPEEAAFCGQLEIPPRSLSVIIQKDERVKQ